MVFQLLLFISLLVVTEALGKVVVTGAAGRTGQLVFLKLKQRSAEFAPVGLVRSEKSIKKIEKIVGKPSVVQGKNGNVKVCDVTSPEDLEKEFKGADAVVLCTSAVPKVKVLSIIKVLLMKLIRKKGRPAFKFIKNGDPYHVDWLGAKNQIDAATKAGVKHFIFVSSMGGTQPENFLNTIGRVEGHDKSGNILLWKRKAEEYLIASGLTYTILHPGGLLDKPGGEREMCFGVDDTLLQRKVRSIPRDDVAEACVQALIVPEARNRSIDMCSKEPSAAFTPVNWNQFYGENTANCHY